MPAGYRSRGSGAPFQGTPNNDAERALRPSVIFRKVTYGFRSSWGADAYAAIRSVISTARLNGRTAFQAITATLKGQSVMPAA